MRRAGRGGMTAGHLHRLLMPVSQENRASGKGVMKLLHREAKERMHAMISVENVATGNSQVTTVGIMGAVLVAGMVPSIDVKG